MGHGGADGEEGNVRGVEEVGVLKRPFLVRGEIAADRGFGFTGTSDAITGVGADGHKIEEGFAGVEIAAVGCVDEDLAGIEGKEHNREAGEVYVPGCLH